MKRKHPIPNTIILILLCALALPLTAGSAAAQVAKQGSDFLDEIAFGNRRLAPEEMIEPLDDVRGLLAPDLEDGWAAFLLGAEGEWTGYVDHRTGRLEYAEGAGIAWLPGAGNKLTRSDIAPYLNAEGKVDLGTLEAIARDFLPRVASLMGVDPAELVLNEGRSTPPASHVWYVDFDVVRSGLPIEGARVVFRVNNGNLIQFGSENLPSADAGVPAVKVSREKALENLAAYIGGFHNADRFPDRGSLHLLPIAAEEDGSALGFDFGRGRGLVKVWQFTFRRPGVVGTWQARVDASSGEVLELVDENHYAVVTGGVFLNSPGGGETVLPMPFANLSSGGYTNSSGVYNYTSGTVSSTLDGQYVKIVDSCGSISKSSTTGGDILFGTSAGTDCTTPGSGGAGNTHSSRTQFYHLNRAKEVGRGWLPSNSWLGAKLTTNVNLNQTCNAYWQPSNGTVNFFRSGGGCGNTGEIAAISLHEYGHGLDYNDGNGVSSDKATGETYGDFTATLTTHSSCIGPGFRTTNCGGYGDACTSCTGVRDIDYAKHSSAAAHTVDNFVRTSCPTSSTYQGPCGREGHCESYVSSEALWDLVHRDLPNPGTASAWTTADRLWYCSRPTATKAFNCTTSGTPWTANGCFTGSYWRALRANDDDDGNLNNGTPNSCTLYAAFNRHGIACTTDAGANTCFAGVAAPAAPSLTLTPASNQVTASWGSLGSGKVYDVFRNEAGCNAGFTRVAVGRTGTSYIDTAVANGRAYYYQVVSYPTGNVAASGPPSTCKSTTPVCTPPAAPTGLSATAMANYQINLSWTSVSGATGYNVYRSTTSGGPYSYQGTTTGTTYSSFGVQGTTYYFVVRALKGSGCESGNSNQASATATGSGPCFVICP